jgi:hypothetical protein
VEKLLMNRRKLVEVATRKKIFADFSHDPTPEPRCRPLSRCPSLVSAARFSRIIPPAVTVHTYEKEIAGRTYLIEVSFVTASRWRAQIARRPGMPTSLMPFYGQTPDEAARELGKWLSLVSVPATANT